MKKRNKTLTIVAAVLTCTVAVGLYNGLKVQNYSVETDKINSHIRIALITDLHSCKYGKDEIKLIKKIDKQKPDIILLSGDIFDHRVPDDNTEAFLKGVSEKYPCYYVTGNHEYRSGEAAFAEKMKILEKYSVIRLSGEAVTTEINSEKLNLCGVDDPLSLDYPFENTKTYREQLDSIKGVEKNGNYTILLSHRPELMPVYSEYDFDMVLAGHAHGGQWRIPFILNGLVAPNQGFFPDYAGGIYEENGTKMIVSRGLAKETTIVPRFYNRPEVVIIDLK